MSGIVWLASYPKSGNTWLRLMLANLDDDGEAPFDINAVHIPVASARKPFDDVTLLDSNLLTPDEADRLRPGVLDVVAGGGYPGSLARALQADVGRHFIKVHDAYTRVAGGAPLLGAARGAIVIVRDPRAVAPSLAHHLGCSIDRAIEMMAWEEMTLGGTPRHPGSQLRQRLLSWSAHVLSWLDQGDMPVHPVRYEDLKADAASEFRAAMAFAGLPVSGAQAARAARRADFATLQEQERAHGFREVAMRQDAPFFRRGEAEAWRDELTPAQIARIEARHGEVMRKLGYAVSQGRSKP